jgi:cell division septation protein DedD
MSPTQIAAILFLGVTILGILGTVSYTVGRARSAPVATEPVVVSKPVEVPAQATRPSAAELVTSSAPESRPVVAQSCQPFFQSPAAGETYLQASATTQADSETFVQLLREQGFPARYTTGPSESIFRVLIGPIRDEDHYRELKARLDEAGLEHFERRYPSGGRLDEITRAGVPAP